MASVSIIKSKCLIVDETKRALLCHFYHCDKTDKTKTFYRTTLTLFTDGQKTLDALKTDSSAAFKYCKDKAGIDDMTLEYAHKIVTESEWPTILGRMLARASVKYDTYIAEKKDPMYNIVDNVFVSEGIEKTGLAICKDFAEGIVGEGVFTWKEPPKVYHKRGRKPKKAI